MARNDKTYTVELTTKEKAEVIRVLNEYRGIHWRRDLILEAIVQKCENAPCTS